jgi:hypothetical protein
VTCPTDATHQRDERANAVYEQLSAGVTTADAGVIADDIATMVRQTEAASYTVAVGDHR